MFGSWYEMFVLCLVITWSYIVSHISVGFGISSLLMTSFFFGMVLKILTTKLQKLLLS